MIRIDDLKTAANVRQRCPQLVRNERDKLGFQMIELAQFVVGDFQFGSAKLDFFVQLDVESFDTFISLRQKLQIFGDPIEHPRDDGWANQPKHHDFHAEIQVKRIFIMDQMFRYFDHQDNDE